MSLMNSSANSDYVAITTNEAASIMGRFSTEMIDDVIDQAISTKLRSYSPRLLNVVDALEQQFKADFAQFPQIQNGVMINRDIVYKHIIKKILAAHNLRLNIDLDSYPDSYSLAHMLYEVLIANFHHNIISFFVNYIVKEKSTIYEALKLVDKKSEMSNAVYSKKIFKNGKNSKLAIIHANLDLVINSICGWDISLNDFLSYAYVDNRLLVNALAPLLVDCGRFYLDQVVSVYNANIATLSTDIKFAMQECADMSIEDLEGE